MRPLTARRMRWSERDYLAMQAESPIKHEYLDGEVFAMAGARPEHNQIAAAALVALGLLVRGGRCRVFNSDQRIYIPETGLYTYADGGVACGRWEIHHDAVSLLNPTLLLEVLSTSTRDYDCGAKLEHYKQFTSLRHVLILDEPARRVEHHQREGDGWAMIEVCAGSLQLADLGGSITLDEVYLPVEV